MDLEVGYELPQELSLLRVGGGSFFIPGVTRECLGWADVPQLQALLLKFLFLLDLPLGGSISTGYFQGGDQ